MSTEDRTLHRDGSEVRKPYAMLGAGPLTVAIWKTGDIESGWRYHFNLFRMNPIAGRVSQRFTPADVKHLARLTELIALTLADDGCLSTSLRRELRDLAQRLNEATERCSHNTQLDSPANVNAQLTRQTNNRSSQQGH